MKNLTILIVMALLCQIFSSRSQDLPERYPLKVGDEISAKIWSIPFKAVNHPKKKSPFKLEDYSGKIIILDFWATWCGSCLSQFTKSDSLQKKFRGKLAFILVNSVSGTGDTQSRINDFFSVRDKKIEHSKNMPSIIGDTLLRKLFPHVYIPHYVWIGRDGKVKAITAAKYITEENISALLKDGFVNLPEKQK